MSQPNIETNTQPAVLTGGTMGVKVGNSASEVVGFHGATGVAQATAITALGAGVTLTGTYASDYVALQTELDAIEVAVNALITALKNKGFTA